MAFCFSSSPLLFAFVTSDGARGEQDAPRVFPALPYRPPATRPAPARHPNGEGRGARPPRGRRTKALRLEGGGKVAASPPPRLPVARGAFLGSDPRRAAKGAAGEGCRFPESGRNLPPSARVSLGGSSGFKYPPEGLWLGHFQGRGDGIRALWVGGKPRSWGLRVFRDWRTGENGEGSNPRSLKTLPRNSG